MGSRGRRSAADLATPRPQREMMPIDFDAFARRFPDTREATRALMRAERVGQAARRVLPDGTTEWLISDDLL